MHEIAIGVAPVIRIIEATIDETGSVQLLKPVRLSARHRALVTIRENEQPIATLRPFGLCVGEFVVPDDFDESLSFIQ